MTDPRQAVHRDVSGAGGERALLAVGAAQLGLVHLARDRHAQRRAYAAHPAAERQQGLHEDPLQTGRPEEGVPAASEPILGPTVGSAPQPHRGRRTRAESPAGPADSTRYTFFSLLSTRKVLCFSFS